MEVHHHPHTSRKKFRDYAFEFAMLFIAVFCGFLADNILEHRIEKSREKQYIRSFMQDLEADTTTLNERIRICDLNIARVDSSVMELNRADVNNVATEIYYFLRWIHRSDVFTVNDRTIVQLRNAGGMRMVSIKSVSDSIVSYYKEVEYIHFIYSEITDFKHSLRPHYPVILDGNDYGKTIDGRNAVVRSREPSTIDKSESESNRNKESDRQAISFEVDIVLPKGSVCRKR